MKKIIIITVALLIPLAMFAETGGIAKGSPEFSAMEALASAGAVKLDAAKEAMTRQEAADYLIAAMDYLLSSDNEPSAASLETAYMLLMELETDLLEKGLRLSEIQRKMVDLKVRKERLNLQEVKDRQDKLFGMIGVKINGEAAGFMTDLVLYGDKIGIAKRYTPLTQYIDLKFIASSGSQLKAEAVFRLENLFGGSWGAQDIYGVRRFNITGDFPVKFELGDYQAKLTPFTIWAVDEERESESPVFGDKRCSNKQELFLDDMTWPLTGGKLEYKTEIAGASIDAVAMAARLQDAGKNNYQTSAGYAQTFSSPWVFAYDQYMWAGSISSDFSLKDILKAGINFVQIKDIKGTGTDQAAKALDNYTASADAKVSLFGIAKASAEFAFSGYCVNNSVSPQSWQNDYIYDTALMTALEAEYLNTKLEAEFFVVGNSFTAYAAQTRMYDQYNNYPYVTQNNTWNIAQPIPAYIMATKVYPFTRYNNVILASYYPVGYNLMPWTMSENNASPYGDSTPNRQGIKAKLSGKYLDGMIEPYAKFLMSYEIVSYLPGVQSTCPRDYMVLEGGAKVKAFDIVLAAGYKFEVTDNEYTQGGAHLESAVINAGLEYTLFDRLRLSVGFKDIAFTGTDYPYSYTGFAWAYGVKTSYDEGVTSFGAGADFEFTKQASAAVSYTDTKITDRLNSAASFGAQEFDFKVNLNF